MFRSSQGQAMEPSEHRTKNFNSNKTFYGIGAGMGIMAALPLSSRIKFIAEPGLQYFGINSIKVGNNIRERSIAPGLMLGLRYTLF
jgi:hypothetical protein